jgi:hypothetical protein
MRHLLALLCLALPVAAWAQEETMFEPTTESGRHVTAEFNLGGFRPDVDSESGLTAGPYQGVFGGKKMLLLDGEVDYEFFHRFGTLGIGLEVGYGSVKDQGIVAATGERSSVDSTSLKVLPLTALLVYRFDWLWQRLGIPLVPFAKVGPGYTFWWSTNGGGDVDRFTFQGQSVKASGAKWGYEVAGGLSLVLNFLDPVVGREADQEFGMNSAVLSAAYVRRTADNFGKAGMVLSGSYWLFGVGVQF